MSDQKKTPIHQRPAVIHIENSLGTRASIRVFGDSPAATVINSWDTDINAVVIYPEAIEQFVKIDQAIMQLAVPSDKKEELLRQTGDLKNNFGKPTFSEKYMKLISAVGAHADVVSLLVGLASIASSVAG